MKEIISSNTDYLRDTTCRKFSGLQTKAIDFSSNCRYNDSDFLGNILCILEDFSSELEILAMIFLFLFLARESL